MAETLKRCPHCGGIGTLMRDKADETLRPYWQVHCKNCHLATFNKKDSIAAWNRREDARQLLLEDIVKRARKVSTCIESDRKYMKHQEIIEYGHSGCEGLLQSAIKRLDEHDTVETKPSSFEEFLSLTDEQKLALLRAEEK